MMETQLRLVKWTLMYRMNQWNYVTWISVEQINVSPSPFKKKNRLYKVSEAELSLGNIKTDVKWFQDYLPYTACPILPYIEYDELLYPFKYMKCIWLPRSVPSFNTFAELQIS